MENKAIYKARSDVHEAQLKWSKGERSDSDSESGFVHMITCVLRNFLLIYHVV